MAVGITDELLEAETVSLSDIRKPRGVRAAIDLISTLFADDNETRMWQAVLELAILDAATYDISRTNSFFACDALWYLRQESIPACEVCGVSSELVRRILRNQTTIPV